MPGEHRKRFYWHRELPPFEAEAIGEHVVEATSSRVPGTLEHREELWDRCYGEVMDEASTRLELEVARLGATSPTSSTNPSTASMTPSPTKPGSTGSSPTWSIVVPEPPSRARIFDLNYCGFGPCH
jgi:hypothetical protein